MSTAPPEAEPGGPEVGPYRERTRELAAETEAAVAAAVAAYQDGDLTRTELAAVVALIVAAAMGTAASVADLALAAVFAAALGVAYPAVGVLIPDPRARLELAVLVVLEGPEKQVPTRLARLARAEPLAAGREATTQAMTARRTSVRGWIRHTGPNPCPLCTDLANGDVLPPDAQMIDHPGCSCVKRTVIDTTKETP